MRTGTLTGEKPTFNTKLTYLRCTYVLRGEGPKKEKEFSASIDGRVFGIIPVEEEFGCY